MVDQDPSQSPRSEPALQIELRLEQLKVDILQSITYLFPVGTSLYEMELVDDWQSHLPSIVDAYPKLKNGELTDLEVKLTHEIDDDDTEIPRSVLRIHTDFDTSSEAENYSSIDLSFPVGGVSMVTTFIEESPKFFVERHDDEEDSVSEMFRLKLIKEVLDFVKAKKEAAL